MEILELIVEVLDIFNNPTSIVSAIVGVGLGVLMCVFAKTKAMFGFACICLSMAIFGLGVCILSNDPEFLGFPLALFPFSVVILVCWVLKVLIKKTKVH